MVATLTSSSSSSRSSTFDNSSDVGRSTSPTSPSSHQSSDRASPSSANNLSTCDSASTGGHPHADRDNSSQVVMKRFIFGDYNIDWRSIPAVDEDSLFNRATLLYRRDLRCKASREYYMEILNGFRIKTLNPSASLSENNTILIDGEEVVDMIG